jgi:ribosome-binding protein aMBF1 (putative translation factor)
MSEGLTHPHLLVPNSREDLISLYGMKHTIKYEKVNMVFKPLTSAQIRAARALLRWSADELARETTVGVTTIRRAELSECETSMTTANDLAVRRALESAGVEFIDENGGGPGVRLRKGAQKKR